MPTLRFALPLWLDTRSKHKWRRHRECRGHVEADVVIVGGGITGACLAWVFASAGIRVALLEAARVGRGSTAASTALLMQEPDKDFVELEAQHGAARTKRIWQLSRAATRGLVRTLRRLRIACELSARDSIYYTIDDAAVRPLAREYRLRCAAGIGGTWLDAAGLRRAAGIRGAAAIRTRGNAQVNPDKACIGLLRAAERRGARIFEGSPVRRIQRHSHGVTVSTSSGRVRADVVLVATGYATPEFKPLAGRFKMLQTYVVATERLTARRRAALGLGNVMLWDTGRPYFYARWSADHRLLLGGADRPPVGGRRRRRALSEGVETIRDYFVRLYPALAGVRLEYAWEGLFATTPDGLPYVGPHRRYPRHLFALGYGGNGMTFGFLAARMLLEQYRGVRSSDHRLLAFDRRRRTRR